jgi:hypothetical protein
MHYQGRCLQSCLLSKIELLRGYSCYGTNEEIIDRLFFLCDPQGREESLHLAAPGGDPVLHQPQLQPRILPPAPGRVADPDPDPGC